MRRRTNAGVLLLILCCACGTYGKRAAEPDLTALALQAMSEDRAEAEAAAKALRAHGAEGLAALMSTYRSAIDRHRSDPTRAEAMWPRLAAALDGVAAQKDAWAAGLYWYTDLEAAKAEAARTGRPILSLRLLGTLDTEFSCANSRFFRTVLYPNAAVGKALRDGFVLHWQSHRPVPRLTIDFGDGRKIERTITGNSVHYVLTPDGRTVDAIPGLYGPAAFLRAIGDAAAMARSSAEPDFARRLARFHASRLATVAAAWENDLRRLGAPTPAASGPAASAPLRPGTPPGGETVRPTAALATRLAVSKSGIEMRPVAALATDRAELARTTDDALWPRLAALHADDARLDEGSRAVIRAKLGAGGAIPANDLTGSKRRVEDPVVRIVGRFEQSVAEDTVRNEYDLHGRVHEWFATGRAPSDLNALNEQVYSTLFLMPSSDPFLGLVPADAYTALPADTAKAP
jgi:hypothetical protein